MVGCKGPARAAYPGPGLWSCWCLSKSTSLVEYAQQPPGLAPAPDFNRHSPSQGLHLYIYCARQALRAIQLYHTTLDPRTGPEQPAVWPTGLLAMKPAAGRTQSRGQKRP